MNAMGPVTPEADIGLAGATGDQFAQRLEDVLAGFRTEQTTRDRRAARRRGILAVAITTVMLIGGGVVLGVHHENTRLNHLRQVDLNRSAQTDWDRLDAAHDACLRQANGRIENRTVLFDIIDIATAPRPGRTAAEQARADMLVKKLKASIITKLPDVDCDKVAPGPKGQRPVVKP